MRHLCHMKDIVLQNGGTAMSIAAERGHIDILRLLLENKAHINEIQVPPCSDVALSVFVEVQPPPLSTLNPVPLLPPHPLSFPLSLPLSFNLSFSLSSSLSFNISPLPIVTSTPYPATRQDSPAIFPRDPFARCSLRRAAPGP
jgi:hypothetical protein